MLAVCATSGEHKMNRLNDLPPSPPPGEREKHLETLKAFARAVLDGYRTGEVGDIDGGWLQDKALELGLLVASDAEGDPNFYISPTLESGGTVPGAPRKKKDE